jgi:NAD(P)-dependent dehydrogenase (short-subunit alcohol dehydrogenase family)
MITLITGGAQGIGFATAEAFIGAGHKVCLFDLRGTEDAVAKLGSDSVVSIDGDVTREADVDAAIEKTVGRFGGIDCVVTAAGIVKIGPAAEVEARDFAQTMAVNVLGSFLPAQRAARVMLERGGGNIVFVGSVYGVAGAPHRTSYCASKGAVHNLTRALAVEWGPMGIRVNCVAPTGVLTPMVQDLIDRGIYNIDVIRNRTPLGRLAEADEIASAILYLAGSQAQMISGVILPVDGGWTAHGFTATPK